MNEVGAGSVLVQVVSIDEGREISWRSNRAETLKDRMGDLQNAIAEGTLTVADSLPGLPSAQGWRLGEVSASFGLALTAEAGVVLSKVSAGATFDVTVTFQCIDEQD